MAYLNAGLIFSYLGQVHGQLVAKQVTKKHDSTYCLLTLTKHLLSQSWVNKSPGPSRVSSWQMSLPEPAQGLGRNIWSSLIYPLEHHGYLDESVHPYLQSWQITSLEVTVLNCFIWQGSFANQQPTNPVQELVFFVLKTQP